MFLVLVYLCFNVAVIRAIFVVATAVLGNHLERGGDNVQT